MSIIGVVVVAAGWLLLLAGCELACMPQADEHLGKRLENALEELGRDKSTEVKLDEIAGFEFDRVYFFGPYTLEEDIDEALGFEWGCADGLGLENIEGTAAVVFVRGEEVIRFAWVSTEYGRPSPGLADGLAQKDAVIVKGQYRGQWTGWQGPRSDE